MKKTLIVVSVFLATLAFAETSYKGFSQLPEPLTSAEGSKLFHESGCATCHGASGKGDGEIAAALDPKPRNFTSYTEMARLPDLQMEQSIRSGKAGTAMPAFGDQLNDKQIREIIVYLRSLYAKSYLTINMCVNETYIVDTRIDSNTTKAEVDEQEKLQVKKDGKYLHITAKHWPDLMAKKVYRSHIRLIDGNKNLALIAVRFHNCLADNEQASAPCDCRACKEGTSSSKSGL